MRIDRMSVDPHGPPRIVSCPIGESLGVLGQKWTLSILRDILVYGHHRFSQFLESNDGLTPRMLSRRLQEMQDGGLIAKEGEGKQTRYTCTDQGHAVLPVLEAFMEYGSVYHADIVFSDGKPRTIAALKHVVAPFDMPWPRNGSR